MIKRAACLIKEKVIEQYSIKATNNKIYVSKKYCLLVFLILSVEEKSK